MAVHGKAFYVAAYDRAAGQEHVIVSQLVMPRHAIAVGRLRTAEGGEAASAQAPTHPLPWIRIPLAASRAAPRDVPPSLLSIPEESLWLAYTDAAGVLRSVDLPVFTGKRRDLGEGLSIAQEVDDRFSPALAVHGSWRAVAWTARGGRSMRSHLAILDGHSKVIARHDLTPSGMGAAAPTFVQGLKPPALAMVDARSGLSPLIEVVLDQRGKPQAPTVTTTLGSVTRPPRMAAAAQADGSFLAYTVVGTAATTAIGIVQLRPQSASPKALVPGTAYVPLRVAASATGGAPLFAALAPKQPGKDVERRLSLRRWTGALGGSELSIDGSGDADHPSLAYAAGGVTALVFARAGQWFVAWLNCADEP